MDQVTFKDVRCVKDINVVKTRRKQILNSQKNFTDKDFPLGIGIEEVKDRHIHWKRIVDLDVNPRLFAESKPLAGTLEVGLLKEYNLVAVLTSLRNHMKLLNYVFPPGQDFNSPDYCGFFYFRFWKMGKWVYVYVDDKLPVLDKKLDVGKNKSDRKKQKPESESQTSRSASLSKVSVAHEPELPVKETITDQVVLVNGDHNDDGRTAATPDPLAGTQGKKKPEPATSTLENVESGDAEPPILAVESADDSKKPFVRTIFLQFKGVNGDQYYWAALLEKAYAKLCGGYDRMVKTDIKEILLDITGGILEVFFTNYLPPHFFLSLKCFSDNRAIILATTSMPKAKTNEVCSGENEERQTFFALTHVVLVDFQKPLGINKMIGFVRVGNPAGALDWENNWLEASREWEIIPEEVRSKFRMLSRENGEFYLTYDNFLKAFSSIIVSTVPDGSNFNCEGYFGIWTRPRLKYSLCSIDQLKFHEFSQHKIWVRDPNSHDDLFVEVLISLVQSGSCCCSISPTLVGTMFFLFCLQPGRTYNPPLGFNFFRYNKPIGCSNYSTEKEVSGRFNLPPGHYLVVVVPDHTNIVHPCLTNDYLLRVVTPAEFPKPPPPHEAATFCGSENLNIYFDYAEMLDEPKASAVSSEKEPNNLSSNRTHTRDKNKGKKRRPKQATEK